MFCKWKSFYHKGKITAPHIINDTEKMSYPFHFKAGDKFPVKTSKMHRSRHRSVNNVTKSSIDRVSLKKQENDALCRMLPTQTPVRHHNGISAVSPNTGG